MPQVKSLLALRIFQVGRFIKTTGIFLILLALFLLTGTILSALSFTLKTPEYYAIPSLLAILFSINYYRTDLYFLKRIFGDLPKFTFYIFLEYLLISIPIFIFHIYFKNWLILPALLLCIAISSYSSIFIRSTQVDGHKRSFAYIPLELFELKFFVEKNRVMSFIIALFLTLGVAHISFWVVGMFFLLMMPLEVFQYYEPKEMIDYKSNFISNKIGKNIKFVLPFILLTSMITWVASSASIWVFIYGIACILISIIISICGKYAAYNGLKTSSTSLMPLTMMTLLMILPGFILISSVFGAKKYFEAEEQMNQLFNPS